jgi:hypothetical protein
MKYYFRLNQDNIIVDAITFPVEGYIEYETDYPLPAGINGGWWKFENGQPVEYPELKPETELEQHIADLENAIMELSMIIGGMM